MPSLAAACDAIPPSCRAFLALGSQHLAAFAERDDVEFVLRMVDPPAGPLPIPNARIVIGKPGTARQEEQLLRSLTVDVLVCRNSGGDASFAKLEAAGKLSLPVIMIDRPAKPAKPGFETVEAVAAHIGLSLRPLFLLAGVAKHVRIAGIVKRRIAELHIAQNRANHDECRSGQLGLTHVGLHIGKRRADIELVRPGRPVGNDHGTVGTVMRLERPAHIIEIANGEVDGQRRSRLAEDLQPLAVRH